MITLSMTLLPYGSGIGRYVVFEGQIWSSDDNLSHYYRLTQEPDSDSPTVHEGFVPKNKSGHKDPIDLLYKIAGAILEKRDDSRL